MIDRARTTWEAFDGVVLIDTNTRKPNGKKRMALVTRVIVCFSKEDVKAMTKKFPGMKFVERTRDAETLPAEARKRARRPKARGKGKR